MHGFPVTEYEAGSGRGGGCRSRPHQGRWRRRYRQLLPPPGRVAVGDGGAEDRGKPLARTPPSPPAAALPAAAAMAPTGARRGRHI